MSLHTIGSRPEPTDSGYAWLRLAVALLLGTIGSVGMWSFVVALPTVQADFGVTRAEASLPYTTMMVGFAVGNAIFGKMADRFGILWPILCAIAALALGYVGSGLAPNLWLFAIAHMLAGLGASASFAPMIADISHWFERRRGIAVAVAASGNYLAGTVWPPVIQYFIANSGWRPTHIGIGLFCVVAMLPLSLMFRRRAVAHHAMSAGGNGNFMPVDLGISPNTLMILLCIASVSCCVAMAMPQAHIVAYCGDLGYGVARGAEMLSLMLGFGIVSRLASGFIADRIGGVRTLLVGSVLQAVALGLYLVSDGLTPLYVISALFGLFQGGIVPSYAIIVREYFVPKEAGARLGIVIMASVFGMALGGWVSGLIFDLTGSYMAAFAHGILWNLLNISIALWLLLRGRERLVPAGTNISPAAGPL